MSYRLSPLAVTDIDQIATYLSERNQPVAHEFIETLERQFALLGKHQRLGRARPELRPELRSWAHRSYVVLYRVVESRVEIIRVIHGSRDLVTVLNEKPISQN